MPCRISCAYTASRILRTGFSGFKEISLMLMPYNIVCNVLKTPPFMETAYTIAKVSATCCMKTNSLSDPSNNFHKYFKTKPLRNLYLVNGIFGNINQPLFKPLTVANAYKNHINLPYLKSINFNHFESDSVDKNLRAISNS